MCIDLFCYIVYFMAYNAFDSILIDFEFLCHSNKLLSRIMSSMI